MTIQYIGGRSIDWTGEIRSNISPIPSLNLIGVIKCKVRPVIFDSPLFRNWGIFTYILRKVADRPRPMSWRNLVYFGPLGHAYENYRLTRSNGTLINGRKTYRVVDQPCVPDFTEVWSVVKYYLRVRGYRYGAPGPMGSRSLYESPEWLAERAALNLNGNAALTATCSS